MRDILHRVRHALGWHNHCRPSRCPEASRQCNALMYEIIAEQELVRQRERYGQR